MPGNRLFTEVSDGIGDACLRTGNTVDRHSDNTRYQINRSGLGYLYRRRIKCGIIAFTTTFIDRIVTVNNTKYIIFAADAIRNTERLAEGHVRIGWQCSLAIRIPEIDIGSSVKNSIA